MRFFPDLFKSRRAKGDRARDRGDWRKAERAYRAHLRRHPDDTAIWVQHGHALIRVGRPAAAAAAYRVALDRDPDDVELLGQLSFALRDAGQRRDARDALLAFYVRQPSEEIRGEILLLDDLVREDAQGIVAGTLFLSIHDLLGYLKVHPTMSGVQRVQAGIADHAVEQGEPICFIVNSLTASCDILPRGVFWMIPTDAVLEIIGCASAATVDPAVLRGLILAAEDRAVRVSPGRDTTIVLLGAFWALGHSARAFLPNRAAGAKIVAYIYDIIPLSHPQYCEPILSRDFGMSFCEACALVDAFLTISDATRIAVGDFLLAHGLDAIPMRTVKLAHRMTNEQRGDWPVSLAPPGDRGVVAYVSTIEGRKNHVYVVRAWQAMLQAGVDVPDLLFVGRRGWRIEPLMALLEDTGFLGGRVRFVHDLTDGELDAIYRASLFTIFTSFVEGWGLPVGESLARGTPCIASSTSSIPEIGGPFVDYVDPGDLASGIAAFTRAIVDADWRAARRREIDRGFVPRGWGEVASDFFAALKSMPCLTDPGQADRSRPIRLAHGVLLDVAGLAAPVINLSAYARQPWRLTLVDFYDPEPGGAWLRGDRGELVVHTTIGVGEDIELVLSLRGDVSQSSRLLTIAVDGGLGARRRLGQLDGTPIVLGAKTGASGEVRLRFAVDGPGLQGAQGARQFAVALLAVGYARASDSQAAAELIGLARGGGGQVGSG